ncbi:MAG: Ig-like domain-containing protein [bacterium]
MQTRIVFTHKLAGPALIALTALMGCEELQKLIEADQAPVIDRVSASRHQLFPQEKTMLTVEARDPEGGVLSFTWSGSGGTLSSTNGSQVEWTAPPLAGNYKVSVKVRDDKNAETEGSVTLSVIAIEKPTVMITQPTQDAFIPGLGVIMMQALASHPNGIDSVQFYQGEHLLGTDNSARAQNYEQPWRIEGLSGPATIIVRAFTASSRDPGVDSVQVSIEGVTRL